MPLQAISYEDARRMMQPGDVLAFGGKGHFSEIIKMATLSPVSHVGVVLKTQIMSDNSGRVFNQIIESTSLGDFNGVQISRLSDRLTTYDGEVWWLPLKEEFRNTGLFQEDLFYDFMFRQDHKPYDTSQALGSALDLLDGMGFENKRDFEKFFCSELVAAGLQKTKVLPQSLNPSEVTPIDLCKMAIYEESYYQLKGPLLDINGYNCVKPH